MAMMLLIFAGLGMGGVLWLKVKPKRETLQAAILAIFASFFTVLIALWLEDILATSLYAPVTSLTLYSPRLSAVIEAFAIAALVEEGLKFLVLFGILWKSGLRRVQEGMFVGGVQGISFGLMENGILLFTAPEIFLSGGKIAIIRAVALFAHALIGFWMGYLFIRARNSRWPSEQSAELLSAFFIPFLLHGGYNYLALLPTPMTRILLTLLLLLIFLSLLVLGWLKEEAKPSSPAILRILDTEDPISAILQSAPQLEHRRRLCQQLLIEAGITDFVLINLLYQTEEGMVFEALQLPSRSLQTVKLLSNWKVKAEGVKPFEEIVESLKKFPPKGVLPYEQFLHTQSFTLLARPYGEMTLSEYAGMGILEVEQKEILTSVLTAIAELWKNGLEHGRLTPDNVVIFRGQIYLTDVGMKHLLSDQEKHLEFIRRGALYSGIRGDIYALSRLTSWLTGGYVRIAGVETGRAYTPEQVEREITALAIPEPQKREIAEWILSRAGEYEKKGRELLALWLGQRSLGLFPSKTLQEKISQIGEHILSQARELLTNRQYLDALRMYTRAFQVLPHKAELVAAELEKTVEEFFFKGDLAYYSRKDFALAEKFYEEALRIGPFSDVAKKKIAQLYQVVPFSWIPVVLFSIFALAFTMGSVFFLSLWKGQEKPAYVTGNNLRRTGTELVSLSSPPKLQIRSKIILPHPEITDSLLFGEYLFFFTANGSVLVYHTSGAKAGEYALSPGGRLEGPSAGCNGWIAVPYRSAESDKLDSLLLFAPFRPTMQPIRRSFPVSIRSMICAQNQLFLLTEVSLTSFVLSEKTRRWEERWNLAGREFVSEPIYTGNLLLVFTRYYGFAPYLLALSPEDGKELWAVSLPGISEFPSAVSDSSLYFLSVSPDEKVSILHRLDLQNKTISWSVPLERMKFYPVMGKNRLILASARHLFFISSDTGGAQFQKEYETITAPPVMIEPYLFFAQEIPGPVIPSVSQHIIVVFDTEKQGEIQRLTVGNVTAQGLGIRRWHFLRRQIFLLFQEKETEFHFYHLTF